ncbi:MAG: APC family permease [Proteobacteria bacterium]|nr:APC family permease [Pseudomonadota bacterium]
MKSPGSDPKPGLTRVLGAGDAAAIMIANMVGVGILTRPGQVGAAFGDLTLALLAWIAGGLVALCGALVHAELGSRYPLAGGDYVYLRRAYGDFPAFLSGWTSFVIGFPGAIALTSIAASQAVIDILGITQATHVTRLIPALAILGGFSLLHAAGLKWGKRVQNLQVILVLAALVVLVTAAWFMAGPSQAAPGPSGLGGVSLSALAGAGLSIFFAYSGWNAGAYVAGEIREPTKNLPRALIGGVVLVTALYAAVNLAYFQVVPLQEMGRTINIGGEVARKIFGGAGGRVMSLVELVVFLSCTSAMIITGPRICFAMAGDNLFPQGLAGLGPRSGVPVRALWLQSLVAAGLMVTGTFDDILACTIFAILPFAALTTSAVFVLRARDRAGGQRPPFTAPGGWLTPLVFIAVVLVVEAAVVVTAVLDPKSRWNPIFGALLVGTGVPIYWLWRRRAGR